ncbi:MAG: hypothetical protein IT230_12605 [Flavobacteriales bacterium]|nr:hypothetical protein [Flavobacteriales bacterium]
MKPGHAVMVMVAGVMKFLFSPAVSYGFKHSYWETVALTSLGGCIGMLVFFRTGRRVLEWFRRRRLRKRALAISKGQKPKRIFTRTNRVIVRLKQAYGPQGVAFLLTPLLSVPLTALVAAKYFHHDRRTLPFLLSAVVAWSLVLSAAWKFIH